MTCKKDTGKDLFARDISDMGYQSGRDVIGSLLPLVTHMQTLSHKCYVYIKKYRIHNKLRVYTKVQHNTNQISGQNYCVFSRFHVKPV